MNDDLRAQIRGMAFDVFAHYVSGLGPGENPGAAICPWHDDHSPSLAINMDKGMVYCHSCNNGGDVFSFVMAMESCDFPEAMIACCDILGLSYPAHSFQSPEKKAAAKLERDMRAQERIHREVVEDWFNRHLACLAGEAQRLENASHKMWDAVTPRDSEYQTYNARLAAAIERQSFLAEDHWQIAMSCRDFEDKAALWEAVTGGVHVVPNVWSFGDLAYRSQPAHTASAARQVEAFGIANLADQAPETDEEAHGD